MQKRGKKNLFFVFNFGPSGFQGILKEKGFLKKFLTNDPRGTFTRAPVGKREVGTQGGIFPRKKGGYHLRPRAKAGCLTGFEFLKRAPQRGFKGGGRVLAPKGGKGGRPPGCRGATGAEKERGGENTGGISGKWGEEN